MESDNNNISNKSDTSEKNNDDHDHDEEELLQEEAIEHEDAESSDKRITIEEINIVTEMNTSQLAIQEQNGNTENEATVHGYNLWKHPTKSTEKISQTVADKATGVGPERQYTTIHLKIHACWKMKRTTMGKQVKIRKQL